MDARIISKDQLSFEVCEETEKIVIDGWPDGLVLCEVIKERPLSAGFVSENSEDSWKITIRVIESVKSKSGRKKCKR